MCVGYMQILYTILYKGLEHPWILVSMGSWNQSPVDNEGQRYIEMPQAQ